MFNFLKKIFGKKRQNIKNAKNFNQAIKVIKFFIDTLDFEKAQKAINEVKIKENNAYKEIISNIAEDELNIELQKQKEEINKLYDKKKKKLEKLELLLKTKKEKYEKEKKEKEFKTKFKLLKKEINNLTHTNQTKEALKILKQFFEEHKDIEFIEKFYNKEKERLEKIKQKQEKEYEKKLKKDTELEALFLIGKKNIDFEKKLIKKEKKKVKKGFFQKIKEKINYYKLVKKKIEEKKALEEVKILLKEENKLKEQVAINKLENIHKGLIKEIDENILGYELYGKILGAHKISGDTFGFRESKKKYTFFIGDATGHGIKAGFIIALLTRLFYKFVDKKDLKNLVFEINNSLKQDLKTMNFITSIFFEILKEKLNEIKVIGLGHEPILIYRKKTGKVEKFTAGGLAAGIRIIKSTDNIKIKNIILDDGDILFIYSDGLLEAKSKDGKYYGINRLSKNIEKILEKTDKYLEIYNEIIKDVSNFRGGTNFDDDLTILMLKRNSLKDVIKKDDDFLEKIGEENNIDKKELKKLKGKTKEEILKEIEVLKKEKEIEMIIKQLKQLWLNGEILSLKEEAKRYIKQGYIHPKINYYLKKALEHQQEYKISLKEERINNKYKTLKELLKKGDYDTVMDEAQNIILKDGNI